MKLNSLIIAAAALTFTSCSVFTTQGKNTKPQKSQTTVSAELPDEKSVTISDAFDLTDLIAGEWMIITVSGKQITDDDMPYITFDKSTGRFYASDGCNIINGSYSVDRPNILELTDVLSTMKYCPDIEYSAQIAAILAGAEAITVKIDKVGQEIYLRYFNSNNREIMSARKHNMDFLNGNWQIISAGGLSVDSDDATIFIDINELKIHGNTGCNYFNGRLFINPDKANAIDFSNLGCTRKACPNSQQESAILLALEETASAIQGSGNRVMLLGNDGKELLTIKKIATPAEEE